MHDTLHMKVSKKDRKGEGVLFSIGASNDFVISQVVTQLPSARGLMEVDPRMFLWKGAWIFRR